MASEAIQIKLKINYPVILFTVLLAHILVIASKGIPQLGLRDLFSRQAEPPVTLKIRRVKTAKVEDSRIKPVDSVLDASAPKPQTKGPVSLRDLSIGGSPVPQAAQLPTSMKRPGTRPEVTGQKVPKAMNAISLKSQEFKDYSKSFPSGGLAISDLKAAAQKVSDAVVSIEVPDGIEPDQLNDYELKFYGFQRRTAIAYMNSIVSNLDRFQKKHPNYRLPTTGRLTMTARVTYDSEGNVVQIKMVRWTHVNELQTMFEDIVKDIDQLHNPPRALWERSGEFSMFYTLEIING